MMTEGLKNFLKKIHESNNNENFDNELKKSIKLNINMQWIYENMYQYKKFNGFTIAPKTYKALKTYMLKEDYGHIDAIKLKNLTSRTIRVDKPWTDYSKRRQFFEQWIKETKERYNLKGEFSIQDFETSVNNGELIVKEQIDKKQEELKENNEVTLTKIIEQLSCLISTRIQNIEKEVKRNKFILVLLGKKEHEELAEFKKTAEENLSKLSESLDKIKEYSTLSLKFLKKLIKEDIFVKSIMNRLKDPENLGLTLKEWNAYEKKQGYVVSVKKDAVAKFKIDLSNAKTWNDVDNKIKKKFKNFIIVNKYKSKYGDNLGFRYDSVKKVVVLDEVVVKLNLEEAKELGKKLDQDAIYDLANDKEIKLK